MNKKLQVFVSSTYTDLIEERQAAVEAILDAGHIPAGMELFKAGNESQLNTIYKWINESDVYMLILGGRYGSVESKSGKSYTQLEYEYALSKNIPVFSLVLSESFLKNKINSPSLGLFNVMEQNAPNKYQSFKSLVMSKIIREVDDCKDIKIQVHATLNEFAHKYNLIGWVRNIYENDNTELLKSNALLIKENNDLTKQINKLQNQINTKINQQLGRFTYDEIVNIFTKKFFSLPSNLFGNENEKNINALDFYYLYFPKFATGIENNGDYSSEDSKYVFYNIAPFYIGFGFLEKTNVYKTVVDKIQSTKLGASLYAILESKMQTNN